METRGSRIVSRKACSGLRTLPIEAQISSTWCVITKELIEGSVESTGLPPRLTNVLNLSGLLRSNFGTFWEFSFKIERRFD